MQKMKSLEKISKAYFDYKDIDGFAKVATIPEIQHNDSKLSIPLYVTNDKESVESDIDNYSFDEIYESWKNVSQKKNNGIEDIISTIGGNDDE